ncbi:ICMT-domain-containing protein [Trametes maxima]|nr:ICMT-domain-containing protein [Trametes maxima]
MVAEYFAYVSPNPPPMKDERSKYGKGDTLSRIVVAAQFVALVLSYPFHLIEIAAIVVKDSPTPTSRAFLSSVLADPSAADRLTNFHPVFVGGIALLVFGGAVRKWCYVTLGRYFTYQLALLKEHKLITSGPYAVVRHPAYTGFFSAVAGMLMTEFAPDCWMAESGLLKTKGQKAVLGLYLVWVSFTVLSAVRRIPKEDKTLKEQFGAQWKAWARTTPYALIPGIY